VNYSFYVIVVYPVGPACRHISTGSSQGDV